MSKEATHLSDIIIPEDQSTEVDAMEAGMSFESEQDTAVSVKKTVTFHVTSFMGAPASWRAGIFGGRVYGVAPLEPVRTKTEQHEPEYSLSSSEYQNVIRLTPEQKQVWQAVHIGNLVGHIRRILKRLLEMYHFIPCPVLRQNFISVRL